MKNFAAIDFETANEHRSSVCSVGLIVVRDGVIIDKYYSLINPRPLYFRSFTTSIHGLTEEDVKDAPDFVDVWTEIAPRIDGLCLAAHNSPFDEGCLKAVFAAYGMPYPADKYTFRCTCREARRKLGNTLPNYQLQTVAKFCGFDLTNHHHALADAEACAQIALKLL